MIGILGVSEYVGASLVRKSGRAVVEGRGVVLLLRNNLRGERLHTLNLHGLASNSWWSIA